MNKLMMTLAAVSGAASLWAVPVVKENSVTLSQSGDTVTVTYDLEDEPGIVTVDIQTNGVSIGGAHLTHMEGDVNKLVRPGTGKTFTWKPAEAWPDNRVANAKAVVSAWATNCPPDYMAVSLVVSNSVSYYANAESVPYGVEHDMYKTDYLLMRKIPAANITWRMGTPAGESGRNATREKPHLVTMKENYYIGVYQVTQRQYELICGSTPSYFSLVDDYATRPVENISYETVRGAKATYDYPNTGTSVLGSGFIGKLRGHSGMEGFDMPSEIQWEFACRAGNGTALYKGQPLTNSTASAALNRFARYKSNDGYVNGKTSPAATCTAANGTAKVGTYEPNEFGLYDMLGNVYEWCIDWFAEDPTNYDWNKTPKTPANSNNMRSFRGGSWQNDASICRCGYRSQGNSAGSNIGLRMAYNGPVSK